MDNEIPYAACSRSRFKLKELCCNHNVDGLKGTMPMKFL